MSLDWNSKTTTEEKRTKNKHENRTHSFPSMLGLSPAQQYCRLWGPILPWSSSYRDKQACTGTADTTPITSISSQLQKLPLIKQFQTFHSTVYLRKPASISATANCCEWCPNPPSSHSGQTVILSAWALCDTESVSEKQMNLVFATLFASESATTHKSFFNCRSSTCGQEGRKYQAFMGLMLCPKADV